MNLSAHISQLLYRNSAVVVPDFGAFVSQKISASIDQETQTILPPRKIIGFDETQIINDGLLINHLAADENITYAEAKNKIEQLVYQWKNELSTKGYVEIDVLGSLSKDDNGITIFKFKGTENYLLASYGLSQTKVSEIENNIITEESTPEESQNTKYTSKNAFNWLKYLIAFALLGGFIGVGVYYINQTRVSVEKDKSLKRKIEGQLLYYLQQETFYIEVPDYSRAVSEEPTESFQINSSIRPYHLVAAAFKSEQKAREYVQILKDKGFIQAFYLEPQNDLYKVIYEAYSDEISAQNALEKVKLENPDAWLFIKNEQ